MGNQNIKIRRFSLTKRNRRISTTDKKINISFARNNIDESSTLINKRMEKIEQILYDISQSFPLSVGFERRVLQYNYEMYTREKEELKPLRDKLLELLKQYDISIKIEHLFAGNDIIKQVNNVPDGPIRTRNQSPTPAAAAPSEPPRSV